MNPVFAQAIGSAIMPAPMAVPATRKLAPKIFPFIVISVCIGAASFNAYDKRCK